ncbi:MAG: hypothetical protein JWP25_1674 [Bradyrhizobium sp.]|jgi:hypothetical protein|nr:hypothetical protein [Bradyrhizobium sp.]MEA2865413.1 hypothetical protein [Bradyrhizobium sp.]
MNTGLYRIELTRLAKLPGFAGIRGSFSDRPEETAKYFKPRFVWLAAALMAGFGAWTLLSGRASNTAESEPVQLAAAVATEPAKSPAADSAPEESLSNPVAAPVETAPVDGLKISSQSWRRGGLGSNALVTFTLRNGNDYAVRDIEISCAFARRDGSHLTDRKRTIHDTVNMKSRRTFARMHVGFVNVNAARAKCSLVTASRT